jgi:hypothetical protein
VDSTVADLCLTVTSDIVDVTPPELVSASISPTSVDVTNGPQEVVLTVEATDDFSGLRGMRFDFQAADPDLCCWPSMLFSQALESPAQFELVSGSSTSGTWQSRDTVAAGTPPETACVVGLMFTDRLGNENSQGPFSIGGTPVDSTVADLCLTVVNTGG